MSDNDPAAHPRGTAQFATTRWSIVLSAGRGSTPDSQRALTSLCETYWYPLYTYARRRVADVHEAQDLTQAFFATLLEKEYVAAADRQRGRFRAFLITAFRHFLSKEWAKAKTQKRGGGRSAIRLDFDGADSRLIIEPAAGLSAEQWYDRQWAVTLLDEILRRLEEECEQAGHAQRYSLLKPFIVGGQPVETYAEVAAQLGITQGAAKMAATRLRRRYRSLLREEIAATVNGEDEIDDEIRKLFAAFEL